MPTKADKTGQELSVEQANAVDLLVLGLPDQEVAEAVGVTRQTVCGWRNHHPAFQAALNVRRHEVWGGACDRLRSLLPLALDALEAAMTGQAPDWRAAAKVVELAGLDRQGYGAQNLGPPSIGPTDHEALRRSSLLAGSKRRRYADPTLDLLDGLR